MEKEKERPKPKTVEELENFPFKNFDELKKRLKEGVVNIGVDRVASLELFQVGVSVDNPHAEALNGSIKKEEVYRNEYHSITDARLAIAYYIHNYNHYRLHSSLDYRTPIEAEALIKKRSVVSLS